MKLSSTCVSRCMDWVAVAMSMEEEEGVRGGVELEELLPIVARAVYVGLALEIGKGSDV